MVHTWCLRRDKTLDKNEMDTYSREVTTTFAGHDFKILALIRPYETLKEPRPRAP